MQSKNQYKIPIWGDCQVGNLHKISFGGDSPIKICVHTDLERCTEIFQPNSPVRQYSTYYLPKHRTWSCYAELTAVGQAKQLL